MYPGFESSALDPENSIWSGCLPDEILASPHSFDTLWDLHPAEYHAIEILGKRVKTPRWQQAYDKTYRYSGERNEALPTPQVLRPVLNWSREAIDERLNGILLNWYDGSLGHYIGKHRDSTTDLAYGTPIVTISLGEERVFRLRPWKGKGYRDFPASHRRVFIMPYETNLNWTHEIPASKSLKGKRISITLRAFSA